MEENRDLNSQKTGGVVESIIILIYFDTEIKNKLKVKSSDSSKTLYTSNILATEKKPVKYSDGLFLALKNLKGIDDSSNSSSMPNSGISRMQNLNKKPIHESKVSDGFNLNDISYDRSLDSNKMMIKADDNNMFSLLKKSVENNAEKNDRNLSIKMENKIARLHTPLPLLDSDSYHDNNNNSIFNENEKEIIKIAKSKKNISKKINKSIFDLKNSNSKMSFFDKNMANLRESLQSDKSPKMLSHKFSPKSSLNSPKRSPYRLHLLQKLSNPINRNLFRVKKISESDSEDDLETNLSNKEFLIMPYNSYKKLFDFIMILIILYSFIKIPYDISFTDCDPIYEEFIEYFIKFCLFIDLILNFFTAYPDDNNKLITNTKSIIWNYLKSWFIIDLFSLLPIWIPGSNPNCISTEFSTLSVYYIDISYHYLNTYTSFRLMQLIRLLKLFNKKRNVSSLTKHIGEKLKISRNIEKLFYFILLFILLNHLSACFWFFLVKLQNNSPESWVFRLGYINQTNLELYMLSLYWTLTTITTVGYGDINAGSKLERLYSLFIMCFGVFMYSFSIGSMGAILESISSKNLEFTQKLQILDSIKNEFKLSLEIYNKVCKVLKHNHNRNLYDKINFLESLPNNLKIEMSNLLYDEAIHKLYFFRDQPAEFVSYVVSMLKPIKFSKGDYLYKIDDTIDEIYLIAMGTISFCLDEVYLETEIKEVKKYNYFGEIEMSLNEKLDYNIKVKSRYCELYVLKKNNFLTLSVNYKEFFDNFMRHALVLYSRFIFNKKRIMQLLEEENSQVQENVRKRNKQIEDENEDFEYVSSDDQEDSEIFKSNSEENSDENFLLRAEQKQEENKEKDGEDLNRNDNVGMRSDYSSSHSESDASKSKESPNKTLNSFNYTLRGLNSGIESPNAIHRNEPASLSSIDHSNLLNSFNTASEVLANNTCIITPSARRSTPDYKTTTNSKQNLIQSKSLFTNTFKLNNSGGSFRNSLAASSLGVLKRFQSVNENNSQNSVPFIRQQIRKNSSVSFKKEMEEEIDERNISLACDEDRFGNLVDTMIDILKRIRPWISKNIVADDPIKFLNALKDVSCIIERNEIIEKIENIGDNLLNDI